MKIIRFQSDDGKIYTGMQNGENQAQLIQGSIFDSFEITDQVLKVSKLLAPVLPTQILCIGLNYRHHAKESGAAIPERPILFTKGINTVQNPGDPIEIPRKLASEEVDYEVELAVVIGRTCKNVSKENALDVVLGYTCANDVSSRDWQLKYGGGQWCRGKTFDTFSPIGPCLVLKEAIPNPNNLVLKTVLNGKTVQDWNTNDMIFDVPTLIEFLSGSTTLPAGTVIFTGTPHGVGMAQKPQVWLKPGDQISVEIEHIGTLSNGVVFETV